MSDHGPAKKRRLGRERASVKQYEAHQSAIAAQASEIAALQAALEFEHEETKRLREMIMLLRQRLSHLRDGSPAADA
jgi:hypothetical protein